ncbi:hypothetical protein Tco_0110448 [Tanacetum coccineum]
MANAITAYEANRNKRARVNDGARASDSVGGWNTYTQSIRIDAAYQTPWKDLNKMMAEEYYPRNELQKMEIKFWNLSYKKIDSYIWRLTPEFQGNVTSSKPTTIQGVIRMAQDLMDQVVRAKAAKNADNKRKCKDNQKGNFGH